MRARLDRYTDPVAWIVEAVAIPIEWLPSRPRMTLLLDAGRAELFARSMTSPVAVEMMRQEFRRSTIDWTGLGFRRADIDEVIEVMLRLIASMLIDPPDPPWSTARLRRFIGRWIGPAVERITVGEQSVLPTG